MTSKRWQKINAVLDAVLMLPPEKRTAYLQANYANDPDLCSEVHSLLDSHQQANSFLEKPANRYAASLLSDNNTFDPLIGTEIDGYHILDVLGRGGMGIVYKAEDVALARTVALKMIDPVLAHDTGFMRRFRSEARALARIDHPYIVRVYAMRQIERGSFIVMEFVDGETLKDAINRHAMSWHQALPIIKQVLSALEYAHKVGVIHRDIKPSNIMLSNDGIVKVADFGLAKLRQIDGLSSETVTATQGLAGTLFYMSPEQVRGNTTDQRSDLYSVGMTLYEMLVGELPFKSMEGDYAVMQAIVENSLPPPSHIKKNLPNDLDQILAKALAKDPAQRYQSAEAMKSAIEAFERQQGNTATLVERLIPFRLHDIKGSNIPLRYWQIGAGTTLLLALGLVSVIASYNLGNQLESSLSTLSIYTEPTEASVYLNRDSISITPLKGYPLMEDSDTIAVRIEKMGFAAIDTLLHILPGSEAALQIRLKPEVLLPSESRDQNVKSYPFVVLSQPPGASILLNGNQVGITPDTIEALEQEHYSLALRKSGYESFHASGTFDPSENRTLNVHLNRSLGTINIEVVPYATVYIDGKEYGKHSTKVELPSGLHVIRAEHDVLGSWEKEIDVRGNDTQKIQFDFLQLQLRVSSNPSGAEIFVDGKSTGKYTPAILSNGKGAMLKPSGSIIEVRRKGYHMKTKPQRFPDAGEKLHFELTNNSPDE